MRILIVTDAWPPQVNGVVRTLQTVGAKLRGFGHEVLYITPEGRRSWALPGYREIELARTNARTIGNEIIMLQPDAIHIATEGPLGWAARRACRRLKLPFTSSFHTRFAEYIGQRVPGSARLIWGLLRRFHRHSAAVMVPTPTIANLLEQRGFKNVKVWTRGVDHSVFHPQTRDSLNFPRPILLLAGRVVGDKNLEAFLDLAVPGTKVIIGDGPQRPQLEVKYPAARFLGYVKETELARHMSAADCFVFPSHTDTFGLVMIEAMACGTPVAAFKVPSPVDVIIEGRSGALHDDLAQAIAKALTLDRNIVHTEAQQFTWERTARMFEEWLQKIPASAYQNRPSVKVEQQA